MFKDLRDLTLNQTTKIIKELINNMDKLDHLFNRFSYWNNRGKSAICRYILEELKITEEEFLHHLHNWKERKLIIDKNGFFEVIIK